MKKILIFYASYGGGHLSAAKSIKEYLEINYPKCDVELIDCIKYINKPMEKITTTAYKEITKKIPWAWGKIYTDSQKGALAHISSKSNIIFAIKLLKLLRQKQPDLIISTHPFGSQMCTYLKRKNKISSKIATILTDFSPHDQWLIGHENTDYFFVAHNEMKNYLIQKNIPNNKIFVTGIPISPKFWINYNKKDTLAEFHLENNKKTILFFGGGEYGLGKNNIIEIFNTLINNFENIQIIAISGKNEKMKTNLENIALKSNTKNNIKILEYTDEIAKLMSISDLVISKPGGLTTSESLASNLPMIIINPIPGQEEGNSEFLEQNKVGIWIKKHDDILDILNTILNNTENFEKMKENTKKIAKKYATKDICEILM